MDPVLKEDCSEYGHQLQIIGSGDLIGYSNWPEQAPVEEFQELPKPLVSVREVQS